TEELPRRFYTQASVKEQAGAFALLLDGRPLRTPKKRALALPINAPADLIPAQGEAQGEFIPAETMPLTRPAHVALDWNRGAPAQAIDAVAKSAETDLLCHGADSPAELVARQAAAWDPLIAWAGETLNAPLLCASGVLALEQPPQARTALADEAAKLDDFA